METAPEDAPVQLSITIESAVAFFDVQGVATRDTITRAVEAVAAVDPKPEVYAAVVMYDQCDMQASDMRDLVGIYDACKGIGLPITMPLAMVVRPRLVSRVARYCEQQGAKGVLRRVFSCREEARQWAQEQAGICILHRAS